MVRALFLLVDRCLPSSDNDRRLPGFLLLGVHHEEGSSDRNCDGTVTDDGNRRAGEELRRHVGPRFGEDGRGWRQCCRSRWTRWRRRGGRNRWCGCGRGGGAPWGWGGGGGGRLCLGA